MELTHSRSAIPPAFLLACVVAVVALVLLLPVFLRAASTVTVAQQAQASVAYETLPPLTQHSQKHPEAQEIHRWLSGNDTRFCKFDCGARGMRYFCRVGIRWAFAVVDEVNTITAYWVSHNYGAAHTTGAGCRPFMDGAHP